MFRFIVVVCFKDLSGIPRVILRYFHTWYKVLANTLFQNFFSQFNSVNGSMSNSVVQDSLSKTFQQLRYFNFCATYWITSLPYRQNFSMNSGKNANVRLHTVQYIRFIVRIYVPWSVITFLSYSACQCMLHFRPHFAQCTGFFNCPALTSSSYLLISLSLFRIISAGSLLFFVGIDAPLYFT